MKFGSTDTFRIIFVVAFVSMSSNIAWSAISFDERSQLKQAEQQYRAESTDKLSDESNLDRLIRYGLLHNSQLKSAFYRWRASIYQIDQAVSLEDPNISYRSFIDSTETRVGPQEEVYGISQKIPFPWKLHLRGEIASAQSRQRYAEYEKMKLQYLYELKNAYFEYWFLHKNILVNEKNMELLKHFEGVAQSRYKSNIGSNQDLLKAQLELGKLQNDILTLNDYKAPMIAKLNAILNRAIDEPLNPPNELDHQIEALDESRIIHLFFENNPDLEKAAFRIEEAKRRVELAKLDYLPDFTVGYDYTRISERPVAVADNGKDASSLMIGMSIPLWFQKQNARVEEAQSNRIVSESERIQTEKNLLSQIKMILFRIKDSQRQIQLYRDALVPKAEQSLKASETAYSSGSVEFLNLIDSERSLLTFQLAYYRAIREYEQHFAELEMIVGQSLRGQNNE